MNRCEMNNSRPRESEARRAKLIRQPRGELEIKPQYINQLKPLFELCWFKHSFGKFPKAPIPIFVIFRHLFGFSVPVLYVRYSETNMASTRVCRIWYPTSSSVINNATKGLRKAESYSTHRPICVRLVSLLCNRLV